MHFLRTLRFATCNLLIIGVSLLSSCRSNPAKAGTSLVPFEADYRAVIARAEKDSVKDGFRSLASDPRHIILASSPLQSVYQASLDRFGRFAILDTAVGGVFLFDRNGNYLGQIGKHGRGPAQYLTPTGITYTGNGFAVVDFTDHRVNVFDDGASFVKSFVYTAENFSSNGILHNQATRRFYLFGNRWRDGTRGKDARLLNVYDESGQFVQSGFPFPIHWLPFNLLSADSPIAAVDEHGVGFFMLSFDPILHRIDPNDLAISDLPLHLPAYSSPELPLPEDLRELKNFHSWELGYTPIRSIAIYSGHIFVEYETHNGLRYTVAVIRMDNNTLLRTVQTNYLMVGADNNGAALFINNPGKEGGNRNEVVSAHLIP